MHCHSPMTLLRGFADDVSLDDWLNKYIWPAEAKWVGEEFIEDGTQVKIPFTSLSHTRVILA